MMERSAAAVVVTYRSSIWIERCLESLRQQPGLALTWVVDNASDDDTVELIRNRYPDVRLIANMDNVGFAAANNMALREIEEPFVLMINPDAALEANALATMANAMMEDDRLAMVGPRIMRGGKIENSLSLAPTPMQSLLFLLTGMRSYNTGGFSGRASPGYPWNDGAEGDHLRGSCMLVRRAAIDDSGLLDERFFLYFEETEWCLRLRESGWKIAIAPHAIAQHEGKASVSIGLSLPSLEYMRSAVIFWQLRYGRTFSLMLRSMLWLMAAVKRMLLLLGGGDRERREWLDKTMRLAVTPYSLPIEYPHARRPSFWDGGE